MPAWPRAEVTEGKPRKANQKATRKFASTPSSPRSTVDAVLMQCLLLGKGVQKGIWRISPSQTGKTNHKKWKSTRGKGGCVKTKGPN